MAELPAGAAELIRVALEEDLGSGDVTAAATVPEDLRCRAHIVLKQPGVVFGLDLIQEVFHQVGVDEFDRTIIEGHWHEAVPRDIALIHGPARAVLAGERVALNFLGHLSGVATLTAKYVEAIGGTGAKVLDTRKTTPGMRLLEKQAVSYGGGMNHRTGLYDAILIKENHIAMAGGLSAAVAACRLEGPGLMVEVEAETLEQVEEALSAGVERILLDNMTGEQMAMAVAMRKKSGMETGLEASGGVNLHNVRQIAETGVDFISIGALTHSAPTLDTSLLLEPV